MSSKMTKKPPKLLNLPALLPKNTRNRPNGHSIVMAERRARVLEMRKSGSTIQQIALKESISWKTAASDLKYCLTKLILATAETTEELREMNNQRLGKVMKAIWNDVKDGKLWAIDRYLAALDQHSKLNGLNKPIPQIISGDPENPFVLETRQAKDDELLKLFQNLADLNNPAAGAIDITPKKLEN